MKKAFVSGMIWLVGMAFVATESAEAQCASSCNMATEHWNFQGITSSANRVKVGMWLFWWDGLWYPVICDVDTGTMYTVPSPFTGYSTRALRDDTSFCLGGGDDAVDVIAYGTTYQCGTGWSMQGFSASGYELSISGESGDDEMVLSSYSGSMNICGYTGNDHIEGNSSVDYVSGGSGNDELNGNGSSDTVRGNDGSDHITHLNAAGTDYLRGENDGDCMTVNGGVTVSSSCGAGTDDWDGADSLDCEGGSICI